MVETIMNAIRHGLRLGNFAYLGDLLYNESAHILIIMVGESGVGEHTFI